MPGAWPSRPGRSSVIDLASNTPRLAVIDAVSQHSYRILDQVREVVRLRQDTTEKGLTEDAMGRGFATLRLFKHFSDSAHVDEILSIAASQAIFVDRVDRGIAISLRVLEKQGEAYHGAISTM